MKLLVLGGTRFLGRHIVDAALARGDDVTIFSRGRSPIPWKNDVTALSGDRDPRIAPGLAALESGTWDVAIDCSGYVPRVVEAGARVLASRVSRYIFVSSMSVYAKTDRPGMDERTPVIRLADPGTEAVMENYGGLKAASESYVDRWFGTRATHVRPGLIVGPHDSSDRFGYWVARFIHPNLLGERLARAVVPAPRDRPLQFIDARDLAAWMLDLAAGDVHGTFNACSPAGQWTTRTLVDALRDATPSPPEAAWIDDDTLVAAGVVPWVGLPLWLPPSERDSAGFMTMDCTRARDAGLSTRPLAQTIADIAHWLASRDHAGAWKNVLTASAERALLFSAKATFAHFSDR